MVKLKKTGVEAKIAIQLNGRSSRGNTLRPIIRIIKSESDASNFVKSQHIVFKGFAPGASL